MAANLEYHVLPASTKTEEETAEQACSSTRHLRLAVAITLAGAALALAACSLSMTAAPTGDLHLSAAMLESQKTDAVAIVQRLLTAYDKGEITSASRLAKYVTPDIIVDTTGPDMPGFQVYRGAQGLVDEVASFASYLQTKTMKQSLFPGPTPDTAYWTWDIRGLAPASGKEVRVKGLDLMKVSDGKVSYIKVYYDDEKGMVKLLGKPDAVDIVQNVVDAWLDGKLYHQSDAATLLTPDVVVDDTRGPDLPGFTKYEGVAGVIAWAKYFDSVFQTTGLKYALSLGPNRHSAYWSYDITCIARESGKPIRLTGFDLFEVRGGRVSKVMVYWDDPKSATDAVKP